MRALGVTSLLLAITVQPRKALRMTSNGTVATQLQDEGGVAEVAASAHSSLASAKKGIGLTSAYGPRQLQDLQVSWYYNWGATPISQPTPVPFVPMVFSRKALSRQTGSLGAVALGFNEPDNDSQSNLTVQEALSLWPQLTTLASSIGSPAMASDPTTTWLPDFMAAKPKVDFIAIHWYKGVSSSLFISDIKKVIAMYRLPVWITEFAPQTGTSARANPTKFTQDSVTAFVNNVVAWMESEPMVQRYAWHDSTAGTSCLYNSDGSLSATGLAYAAATR